MTSEAIKKLIAETIGEGMDITIPDEDVLRVCEPAIAALSARLDALEKRAAKPAAAPAPAASAPAARFDVLAAGRVVSTRRKERAA